MKSVIFNVPPWLKVARQGALILLLLTACRGKRILLSMNDDATPLVIDTDPRQKVEEVSIARAPTTAAPPAQGLRTTAIVNAFNEHALDRQEHAQLQKTIQCYIATLTSTTSPQQVCLEEYIAIAAVEPRTEEERNMVYQYFVSLTNKLEAAGDKEDHIIRAIALSLPLLDPAIFKHKVTALTDLGKQLIAKLQSTKKAALTAQHYQSHKQTISAIKGTIFLLKALLKDEQWREEGLCKEFSNTLKALGEKVDDYPYRYEIALAEQSLMRLSSLSNKAFAKQLAHGYGGIRPIYKVGLAAWEAATTLVEPALLEHIGAHVNSWHVAPWYASIAQLSKAALSVMKDAANFSEFENTYKRLIDPANIRRTIDTGSISKSTSEDIVKKFYYGIVASLATLAHYPSLPFLVRRSCYKYLSELQENSHWYKYQEVQTAIEEAVERLQSLLYGTSSRTSQLASASCDYSSNRAEEGACAPRATIARLRWPCSLWQACLGIMCYATLPHFPFGGKGVRMIYGQGSPANLPTLAPPYTVPPVLTTAQGDAASGPSMVPALILGDRDHVTNVFSMINDYCDQREQQSVLLPSDDSPASILSPPSIVPHFVGREHLMERIRAAFTDTQERTVHLISGPVGMGKTQLAAKLFKAWEQADQYDHTFWLSAATPQDLQASYAHIAHQLGLQTAGQTLEYKIARVQEALSGQACLYVFDNAPNQQSIADYIPTTEGHVLITSRHSGEDTWGTAVQRWALRGLTQEQTLSLAQAFNVDPQPSHEPTMRYLRTEFGGYPLMLALFFSQCGALSLTASECAEKLQHASQATEQDALSLLEANAKEGEQVAYTNSVVAVIRERLKALANDTAGELALQLLRQAAYLNAEEGIPVALLAHFSEVSDSNTLHQALASLEQRALVQWTRDTKEVHLDAVLQHVIRYDHPLQDCSKLVDSLLTYVGVWHEPHNHMEAWTAVLHHGTRLADWLYNEQASEIMYTLTNVLGRACEVKHLYNKALEWRKQNLAIAEALNDKNPPWVAVALSSMAELYYELGQHDQALPLYKRVLKLQQTYLGKDHPSIAATLNNMAVLHHGLGQYNQALSLYKGVLKIRKEHLGKDHPDVAITLNDMARLYQARGQYDQALPRYKSALQIRERHLGNTHPLVATTLNNLAALYQARGQYDQAFSLYNRALQIRESRLGKEHPSVAATLNGIANIYERRGEYEAALSLHKRALKIRETHLGREHTDVATSLTNLAELHRILEQYDQALPLSIRALAIRELRLGKNHPGVGAALNTLAMIYKGLGVYDQALPFYERALKILEQHSLESHPDVAAILNSMGSIYRERGDYERTLPLLRKALKIAELSLGKDHPNVAAFLHNLATTHQFLEEYDKSLPLLERALKILETRFGKSYYDIATILDNTALAYQHREEYDKALSLLARALKIKEAHLGKSHANVADTLNNIAVIYQDRKEYNRAIKLLKSVLDMREMHLGKDHPKTQTTRENLVHIRKEKQVASQAPQHSTSGTYQPHAL